MTYGLNTATIKAIQAVFAKYPEVEKAILYGSRAKGNYRTGSDIDLDLTGNNLDLSILQRIESDLDDLLLPYKLDLSVYRQIQNPELIEENNYLKQLWVHTRIKALRAGVRAIR